MSDFSGLLERPHTPHTRKVVTSGGSRPNLLVSKQSSAPLPYLPPAKVVLLELHLNLGLLHHPRDYLEQAALVPTLLYCISLILMKVAELNKLVT